MSEPPIVNPEILDGLTDEELSRVFVAAIRVEARPDHTLLIRFDFGGGSVLQVEQVFGAKVMPASFAAVMGMLSSTGRAQVLEAARTAAQRQDGMP